MSDKPLTPEQIAVAKKAGLSLRYGHVPEENLEQYRRIKSIAVQFKRLGGIVSGRGEYADANLCWALEKKYMDKANELRVVFPPKKEEP